MFYKQGQAYYKQFATSKIDGPAFNADALPVATASRNGVDDPSFVLTVTPVSTGIYDIEGIVPVTYPIDSIVNISVAATVDTVAAKDVIDTFSVVPPPVTLGDIAAAVAEIQGVIPPPSEFPTNMSLNTEGLAQVDSLVSGNSAYENGIIPVPISGGRVTFKILNWSGDPILGLDHTSGIVANVFGNGGESSYPMQAAGSALPWEFTPYQNGIYFLAIPALGGQGENVALSGASNMRPVLLRADAAATYFPTIANIDEMLRFHVGMEQITVKGWDGTSPDALTVSFDGELGEFGWIHVGACTSQRDSYFGEGGRRGAGDGGPTNTVNLYLLEAPNTAFVKDADWNWVCQGAEYLRVNADGVTVAGTLTIVVNGATPYSLTIPVPARSGGASLFPRNDGSVVEWGGGAYKPNEIKGGGGMVTLPVLGVRVIDQAAQQVASLSVTRGDSRRIPFDLGADFTGWTILFGSKADRDLPEYVIAPKAGEWTDSAMGQGYVDLTSEDTAVVGTQYAEIQLTNGSEVTTPIKMTIKVKADIIA